MNGEKFLHVLSDSKVIENTSLNDLEVLMHKYPYSKNIHLLYLKKKNLLGLTQKSKADEKLAIQHNHPILLNQVISNQISHPDHESINELYNTILSDIEEEKTSNNLNIKQTKSTSPIDKQAEEIIDKEDIVEESIDIRIEKHDRKQNLKEQVELKNKQFHKEDDFTKSVDEIPSKESHSDIKYIEVPMLSSIKQKKKSYKTKRKSKDNKSKVLRKKKAQKEILKAKNKTAKKPKKKINVKPVIEDKEMSYFDWLDNLKTTSEIINQKQKKQTKKKKSVKKKAKAVKKKEKLQSKIDKSLVRNRSIYTETLAILMEKQGHKKEAINIYKQLMLNNPEKNDYFAGRIQKLK